MNIISILKVFLEGSFIGFSMCFLYYLLTKDLKAGFAIFCEKEIQDEAVRRGLISRNTISKKSMIVALFVLISIFVTAPIIVYINKPSNFLVAFFELVLIYLIVCCADFVCIMDSFWGSKKYLSDSCWNYFKILLSKREPIEEAFGYIVFSVVEAFISIWVYEGIKILVEFLG